MDQGLIGFREILAFDSFAGCWVLFIPLLLAFSSRSASRQYVASFFWSWGFGVVVCDLPYTRRDPIDT